MLFIGFLLLSQVVLAEDSEKEKFWVYFRAEDTYKCHNLLGAPGYYAEALHAGTFFLSKEKLTILRNDSDILSIQPVRSYQTLSTHSSQEESYSFALEQIKASALARLGLNGRGVKIGIIDGGFLSADKEPALQHVFKSSQIAYYRDYITPNLSPYEGNKLADDGHGTEVFKLIAGKTNKINFGLAPASTYFLARTDHGSYERRIEEEYVIQSLATFDSLGVDIVNISLGYTNGFDNPEENYIPAMMDGSTTALTRAVDYYAAEKGLLIIVPAGNDGDREWKVISAPADARNALTVGATGLKYWSKADFSSIGSENLGYVKPEVACFSNIGTSFSAPIITGMAACVKQYNKSITAVEIKDIIIQSSHLYPFGNNFIGYGVPDCHKLIALMRGNAPLLAKSSSIPKGVIKLDTKDGEMVVFNKKDSVNVISQKIYREGKVKLTLKNDRVESYITIAKNKGEVREIRK